jgi:alanine racemase
MIRPTVATVDLGAFAENARALRARIGPGPGLFAVVKADAYGHGAVVLARELLRQQLANAFAVSLIEEGLELRTAGIQAPILVMGPTLRGGYDELVQNQLTAMISDASDLEALATIGKKRKQQIPVHLKIDTGMGRLGLFAADVPKLLDRFHGQGISVIGVATHFACADSDDPQAPDAMTKQQNNAFAPLVTMLRKRLGAIDVHAANSAAIYRFPETFWSAVRPGLALYGGIMAPDLRLVMRFSTQIAQIRWIPAGASVSYGATWRARVASRVAVLHAGYADGIPRNASGKAHVLIQGQRCPLVGTITMDMAVADVTALGDAARVGDEAVFFGLQGSTGIHISEVARWSNLIEYEVMCGVSRRVPRHYVNYGPT